MTMKLDSLYYQGGAAAAQTTMEAARARFERAGVRMAAVIDRRVSDPAEERVIEREYRAALDVA